MTSLLSLGFALIVGLLMTRVFKYLHLTFPDVTAFLLAGVLVGPYCLGRLDISGIGFPTLNALTQLSVICDVALGFIAFSIGNEFRMNQLKENGRQATVIGILQAVITTALVDVVLIALHFILGEQTFSLSAAITLGAIAAATAPAATLMVVRQYKAKGKLTSLLLPIVALDDAVGLVLFAVSFGIARALESGAVDLLSILVEPLLEITASLLLGALMGVILTALETMFFSNSNRLALAIGFVFFTIALSGMSIPLGGIRLQFSSLLVCMMLGTTFCNLCPRSEDIMTRSDKWTVPLYAVFFVLSGAELELSVFASSAAVGIGAAYILSRSAGKYLGARLSSGWTSCDENVRKYLGITLLPQAGVALGMSSTAMSLGSSSGTLIRNIVLFSVLIYELFGPTLTRWALGKAGNIHPQSESQKTHERFASKA